MAEEKTIAELWERLQIENHPVVWNPRTKTDRLFFVSRKELVNHIRQQLLERLDLIKVDTPNNQRSYILFGFTGENDEAISFIPINDHDQEFKPTIAQCGELSAMFAFCKWELEQRQKEQQNGN